ncbi:hypothetical protein ACA910_004982 [Epithemia clementina (nom. ined.)]
MSTMTVNDEAARTPEFLRIRNVPIFFRENWATGIGGGLWSTGLAMAKYLNTTHAAEQLERLYLRKKGPINILELGSGNGLLAACWLALGKEEKIRNLVVTDTKEHLPLIQQTLQANSHLMSQLSSSTTLTPPKGPADNLCNPTVFILEHQWGVFQDPSAFSSENDQPLLPTMAQRVATGKNCDFDLIVGSDVAYHEDLYDPLITSLLRFTEEDKDQAVILLGCTMSDTKPEFFDRLKDRGFVYQRLADKWLDAEYQGRIFGIFVVQRQPCQ